MSLGDLDKKKETLRKKAVFINSFKKNGSISKSARVAGVIPGTIHKWMKKDKDFYERFCQVRDQNISEIESIAFEQALGGDPGQVRFLLKAWKPDRYSPQTNMNVNVNENVEIRVAGQDPEEARKMLAQRVMGHIKELPGGQELLGFIKDSEMVPAESRTDVREE